MWNKLLKALGLKKDKKMMEASDRQQLLDNLSKFKFQWIKSERTGEVCKVKDISSDDGLIWVHFTDGTRINYMLLEEFTIKLNLSEKELELNVSSPKDLSKNDIPKNEKSIATLKVEKVETPKSAIKTLLEKQRPNIQQVDFTLQLNIPSESLYDVLMGSFDNAEQEIIDHILESLDQATIREAIKKSIIENIYGPREKNNA